MSQRLRAVAELVTAGNRTADIGCDHGYVSIWLVQKGICPHVIAMDVNRGPLQKAQENIAAHGMSDYIETRLSDGADQLEAGEADSLILAGMGGRLMLRILADRAAVTETMEEWILQPQSEIGLVRRTLCRQGHLIVQENMVKEDGKFYPMMRVLPRKLSTAVPNGEEEGEPLCTKRLAYERYGELLLRERHPLLKEYLELERQKLWQILKKLEDAQEREGASPKSLNRRQELLKEKEILAWALSCYESKRPQEEEA